MISRITSISPTIISHFLHNRDFSMKLNVPVRSTISTAISFKHILGVPGKGEGIPVFKLRVLDNLIERLVRARQTDNIEYEYEELSTENIDSTIDKYYNELKSEIAAQKPYNGNLLPESGEIVNLLI